MDWVGPQVKVLKSFSIVLKANARVDIDPFEMRSKKSNKQTNVNKKQIFKKIWYFFVELF